MLASEANASASSETPMPLQTSQDLETPPSTAGRFQILPEHFAQAIDEQRERYAAQQEIEEQREREARGRQRLLDMATGKEPPTPDGRPALRGWRLWLAKLFGFA